MFYRSLCACYVIYFTKSGLSVARTTVTNFLEWRYFSEWRVGRCLATYISILHWVTSASRVNSLN